MGDDDTPPTNSLVEYRMKRIEGRQEHHTEVIEALKNRITETHVTVIGLREDHEHVAEALKNLKGEIRWAIRVVTTAIFTASLPFLGSMLAHYVRTNPASAPSASVSGPTSPSAP